jgi:hypothetical protein
MCIVERENLLLLRGGFLAGGGRMAANAVLGNVFIVRSRQICSI